MCAKAPAQGAHCSEGGAWAGGRDAATCGHRRAPPTEPLTESQWGPGPHLQAPGLSITFSNYRIIFISNYRKISHDFKTALKEKKVSFLAV